MPLLISHVVGVRVSAEGDRDGGMLLNGCYRPLQNNLREFDVYPFFTV